jgi:hypothetical protein
VHSYGAIEGKNGDNEGYRERPLSRYVGEILPGNRESNLLNETYTNTINPIFNTLYQYYHSPTTPPTQT